MAGGEVGEIADPAPFRLSAVVQGMWNDSMTWYRVTIKGLNLVNGFRQLRKKGG